jgi:hypothetical protein
LELAPTEKANLVTRKTHTKGIDERREGLDDEVLADKEGYLKKPRLSLFG